ncbi:MAG: hypothetical protein R2857_05185 [Vampirovibrionales bacterium]
MTSQIRWLFDEPKQPTLQVWRHDEHAYRPQETVSLAMALGSADGHFSARQKDSPEEAMFMRSGLKLLQALPLYFAHHPDRVPLALSGPTKKLAPFPTPTQPPQPPAARPGP